MVRNTYDFDCLDQTEFYYVMKDYFGGFEELSAKMRNQIRRCFKTMFVRQISSDTLLNEGYDVYKSATENGEQRPFQDRLFQVANPREV